MSLPGYNLAVSSEAARTLERLPHKVAAAIAEFITTTLLKNPYKISKPLHRELQGLRCARRGDYRVLFRISEADTTIAVIRISHRAEVYRQR